MGAEYTLVRVIPPEPPSRPALTEPAPLGPGQATSVESASANEGLRREADRYLQAVAERMEAAGKVQRRVLVAAQPAAAILQEASAGAHLIALETHGRRGLSRFLLGSVADKVVRGSSLPVLVCRPPAGAVT
jgi:nucleotide-binding universal stress UspA family protein